MDDKEDEEETIESDAVRLSSLRQIVSLENGMQARRDGRLSK